MKEEYLHHIFKTKQLGNNFTTTNGERVEIINFGKHNYNSGPDFLECKIKIDDKIWAGQIEFHVKSSDWFKHNHQNDENFNNVILHIVFEYDMNIQSGQMILPTVEIKELINQNHYKKYQNYILSKNWIACQNDLHKIDNFIIYQQKEKAILNRLERKSNHIIELINQFNGDKQKVFFIQLFKAFGTKVNQQAFERLGDLFDWRVPFKLNFESLKIQAYVFGLAGFLDQDIDDVYFLELKNEFRFINQKFQLKKMSINEWKFSNMRPANFPTVRLAQLSQLLVNQNLLSDLHQFESFKNQFNIQLNDYWKIHYNFGKQGKKLTPNITKSFTDLILINVYIPYVFSLARLEDNEILKLSTFDLLELIKPENNGIINKWKKLNIKVESAFDTQALIEQKNEFCSKHKCLNCKIGYKLLRN
jgi:hypothetical protein